MSKNDALSLVGLARRAGGLAVGTRASREALRSGGAYLVLTADDASKGQLDKVLELARRRGTPHRVVANKKVLAAAVGKSAISAVAVTHSSFAERILEELSESDRDDGSQTREAGGRREACW